MGFSIYPKSTLQNLLKDRWAKMKKLQKEMNQLIDEIDNYQKELKKLDDK
jgi:uncharacterized membrane-anchored protein YhcB (DUF1043 family)